MNGHASGGPPRIFDLTTESAAAWQFVLSNWPEHERSRPVLRTERGGFRVLLSSHPEVVSQLRAVCRAAVLETGALSASAEALMAQLDRPESIGSAA